ncbi:hypothetical protein [Klebsiella pneumoniae]|uniref:SLAC1 family transporter n=1 Tax=Klebsiella pneumoniae TaxID=573 RepID=UPI0039B4E624
MNKTQTPRQVLNLPAGYFGMVLGTIGMGFAWRYASTLWPVSRSIGDGLVTLAMAMWVLLSMAFISRAIRFPASVLREMRHPVSSSFVSLFPATTLLVAIGLVPWCRPLAIGLFMLRLMPWYLRQPFNASFWSFSFGISALATTGLHLGQARGDGFFHHLAMPLFIFSNLVVGLLLLRTALLLVSGKLLLQVDRETLLNKKEGS